MEQKLIKLAESRFGGKVKALRPMGGGFYGRVFLAELEEPAFSVILKAYLFPDIAKQEAVQLKTLAAYATVKMPEVYWTSDLPGHHEVLAMEYLQGINLGKLEQIPSAAKQQLAEETVENLLAYHNAVNPKGFGALESKSFLPDWRDYYHPIAGAILEKAEKLCRAEKLAPAVTGIMEQAFAAFDDVFYLPITKAHLIHGDYNTWNVMVRGDLQHVSAVIDPFGCCWADSEFDLYQLDNANGKQLGLLETYRAKQSLSPNFQIKRAFYELFTELNHFYDANVPLVHSNIPEQAKILEKSLLAL